MLVLSAKKQERSYVSARAGASIGYLPFVLATQCKRAYTHQSHAGRHCILRTTGPALLRGASRRGAKSRTYSTQHLVHGKSNDIIVRSLSYTLFTTGLLSLLVLAFIMCRKHRSGAKGGQIKGTAKVHLEKAVECIQLAYRECNRRNHSVKLLFTKNTSRHGTKKCVFFRVFTL